MYYRNDNLDFNSNPTEEAEIARGKHHKKYNKKDCTTDNNKLKSTHTTDCKKHHYTHTSDHCKYDHTHTTDHTTEKYNKMPYAMQPTAFCPYMMANNSMMPNYPMMPSPNMIQPETMYGNEKCNCGNNMRYDDSDDTSWIDDWNDEFCDDMERQGGRTDRTDPRPYHQYPYHNYPYYQMYPYYPYLFYNQFPYYQYPYYHHRPRPWWMR